MGKLRLDLDQLHVESFATDERERERGTVKGNAELADGAIAYPGGTFNQTCMIDFCKDSWMSGCLTCAGTCDNTCPNTCQTCNTCFGGDSCIGGATCMTGCLATCPSGGEICCA
ncbi:MAG: pinensin family lanthipeptide [Longimicrobiaceae bacterium]